MFSRLRLKWETATFRVEVVHIWWLNQSQTESVLQMEIVKNLPEYIQKQLENRHGRAGRGRLWVADELGHVQVDPWTDTPLSKDLRSDFGGIAFRSKDYYILKNLPGIITDTKLNKIPLVWQDESIIELTLAN